MKVFLSLVVLLSLSTVIASTPSGSKAANDPRPLKKTLIRKQLNPRPPKKQEQQERRRYREDGFEDIRSDSYPDNGNGSTTNPKIDNTDVNDQGE